MTSTKPGSTRTTITPLRILTLLFFVGLLACVLWSFTLHWEQLNYFNLGVFLGLFFLQMSVEMQITRAIPVPKELHGRALSELLSFLWWLLLLIPLLEFGLNTPTNSTSIYIGILLVIAPGGLRLWAVRTLGSYFSDHVATWVEHPLITDGPYRWIRHPAYLGSMLQAFGMPLILGVRWSFALSLLLVLLFLIRSQQEEVFLKERIPGYVGYIEKTARFLPGIW